MIVLAILAAATPILQRCTEPMAIDGDTIKCASGIRLRMSGIDAPELPGHCRAGRTCAPGDPAKAKADLAKLLAGKRVTYRAIKVDLYGRTVAVVYVRKVNASCAQLAAGNAIYKPQWDTGWHIKRECGL